MNNNEALHAKALRVATPEMTLSPSEISTEQLRLAREAMDAYFHDMNSYMFTDETGTPIEDYDLQEVNLEPAKNEEQDQDSKHVIRRTETQAIGKHKVTRKGST